MTANEQYGLTPTVSGHSNFATDLIGVGSSLLKSGNCFAWDKQCQENEAVMAQASLEQARAANQLAEQKGQQSQQKMLIIGAGGLLVVIAVFALLLKK